MGFNVVYVEAEPNSEDNIIEALDNYFGTKKFKPRILCLQMDDIFRQEK